MLLDEILKYAHKLIWLARTKLDNTLTQPASDEEAVSGLIPLCGHDQNIVYNDDSAISFSSGPVPDEETDEVIAGPVTKGMQIPPPWTQELASRAFGSILLKAPSRNHPLKHRIFRDKPIDVSVGGLVHKGKPNEELLEASEYATYLNGKIFNGSPTGADIDLSLQLDAGELQAEFPPNVYEYGESEGQARPYAFGTPKGVQLSRVEPGLFQWHDGPIFSTDQVWTAGPPINYLKNGADFVQSEDPRIVVISDIDDSGFVTQSGSSISWLQTGTQKITTSSPFDIDVEVDGSGVELVPGSDGSFEIQRISDAKIITYRSGQFDWKFDGTDTLTNLRDPQVEIILGSGIDFHEVGGRWFKIKADNDSGQVTLNFGRSVKDLELVVRAVRPPNQTVTNWSTAPTSIAPDFDTSIHNHRIQFTSLNSDTLTFDYHNSGGGQLTAIWIENMTVYDVEPTKVTITLDSPIWNLSTSLTADNSSIDVGNFSESFTSVPALPLIPGTAASISSGTGRAIETLTFDCYIGHGTLTASIDSMIVNGSGYGWFREGETIQMKPPPQFVSGPSTLPGTISANLQLIDGVFTGEAHYKVRARLKDSDQPFVYLKLLSEAFNNSGSLTREFRVGQDWRDLTLTRTLNEDTSVNLTIYAERGGQASTIVGEQINPDENFTIEIEYILFYFDDQKYSGDAELFSLNSDDREKLNFSQVPDVTPYKNRLPIGFACYDGVGRVAASEEYSNLAVTASGESGIILSIAAFRQMSILATGEDLITCDFAGEYVSMHFSEQRPWIEHVVAEAVMLDYVVIENDTEPGITIKRRFDYDGYPTDFVLYEDDFVPGSVNFSTGDLRELRYLVEYERDFSDPRLTKTVRSNTGFRGHQAERRIPSALDLKTDAENLAERIGRDAAYNDVGEAVLKGQGHGIIETMGGRIFHPDAPPRAAFEVLAWEYTEDRNTRLTLKAYRRG